MKKRWIVIPSLLVLAAFGVFAAMPGPVLDLISPQPELVVDNAMRAQAIDTLVASLNDHYVFPEKAKQIEAVLREHQREGKYDRIKDGQQLAKQLTDDMRGAVQDQHMMVGFSRRVVPPDRADAPPETQAEWDQRIPLVQRLVVGVRLRLMHYGVDKVERLPSNIGYLKLSGFPPPFMVAEKYAETMDKLADTDGLIIDLRENRGGSPTGVALLVSYFVDQRTRLNDIWSRDTGVSTQQWTETKLDGKRYGGKKPVIILAGRGTMSAGEDFTYTMQALKRATVIGAPTWGGAHPARPYRLGDHFFVMVPDARTISPITHTNWEGVGVIPDVAAEPDKSLALAEEMLHRQLQGATPVVAATH